MARNMKMELLTFSLILYQSKNCGHRIHVLFMMSTDIVKWRKNEWLWKFWKRNDLYENVEKRRGSREKGGGGNEIHAPCACGICVIWDIVILLFILFYNLDRFRYLNSIFNTVLQIVVVWSILIYCLALIYGLVYYEV